MAVTTAHRDADLTQDHLLLPRIRVDGREPLQGFIASLPRETMRSMAGRKDAGVP